MSKYCTNFGSEAENGQRFCSKCGVKLNDGVSNGTETPFFTSEKKNPAQATRKPIAVKWSSLFVVVIIVILGIRYLGPKINTSWAVDAACAEVKSEVYSDYGEVPRVSGELIYKDGQNYIVAVKYEIPGWDWEASCACLVYGYRESNCHVSRMTTEMSHEYNYKANLDELKALWALN